MVNGTQYGHRSYPRYGSIVVTVELIVVVPEVLGVVEPDAVEVVCKVVPKVVSVVVSELVREVDDIIAVVAEVVSAVDHALPLTQSQTFVPAL